MVTEQTSYSCLFDGVELPADLGGHPALELCNTRAGWDEDDAKEYLAGYRHLVALARAVGLVSPPAAAMLPEDARDVYARALRFRDALYVTLRDPAPSAAWDDVAAEVERAACAASTPSGTPTETASRNASSPSSSETRPWRSMIELTVRER